MKPMVSRAGGPGPPTAKCRLGENGKEQAGGAKEELEIISNRRGRTPSQADTGPRGESGSS